MLCLVYNSTTPRVPEALAWMTSLAPVGCLSPAVLTGDEQVQVDRGEAAAGVCQPQWSSSPAEGLPARNVAID